MKTLTKPMIALGILGAIAMGPRARAWRVTSMPGRRPPGSTPGADMALTRRSDSQWNADL